MKVPSPSPPYVKGTEILMLVDPGLSKVIKERRK